MAMKILIADDEPDFCELVRQKFQRELRGGEMEFIYARNGLEALEMIQSQPDISIILTDINMPTMDGLTFLSKLDKTNQLRLALVVSAYGDMRNIRSAMNGGAFDFLTKPIDFDDLRLTLLKTVKHLDFLRDLKLRNSELSVLNKALNEAVELRNDLLGIASHDLKNPLQSVMGFSELIQEKMRHQTSTDVDTLQTALAESGRMSTLIHQSAMQMLDIVKGLLDSSALESGKIQLNKQPIDLTELVMFSIDQNRLKAKAKNQEFVVRAAFGHVVSVDWAKTIEVIDNLISNAIKYSPQEKRIWIELKAVSREPLAGSIEASSVELPADRLQLSVRDEGLGMTAEDLEKVFGKFQRLSARPTAGESSTGLGLSIAKQLIELHGGRVWAESKGQQHGSTFFIELPTRSA